VTAGLRRIVFSLLVAAFFSGCAAAPRQPLTGLIPGKEVETLQSSISISVRTPERSVGGRGFLVFKRPDRFHLAVLSPFGLTLMDLFSDGDRFTCVIPSRQTAYSGLISELPDRDGLKAWAMMRWVVERQPVAGPALERDNVNAAGVRERLYRNVDGVAVPESIELSDSRGDTVQVVFEDPEVNRPVEEGVLSPRLEGVKVLPFTEFHGF